jgi:predicted DNA binding protein
MPPGVYERKSLEIRFWDKVNKTETCWLWTSKKNPYGYGEICNIGNTKKAHRISWLLAGNTIPEGHVVRHKCRNRHCVNPEHLETGTIAENNADKVRDGTTTRGTKHALAKLTEDQVRAIRARHTEIHRKLAEEFGITQSAVTNIIHRRTWKHLE